MKQFIVRYPLFLGLLFALLYFPTSPFSVWLNEGQRELTLFFLHFFLEPDQLQEGAIWINPHYKIIITQACNGMIPILFLFASILAFPSTIWTKLFWMIFGYIVFSVVNVARLLFVVHATQTGRGYGDFYWSHDIVGNMLLMGTGLLLFVGFIKSTQN